jgi:hypothetical protein
MCRTSMLVAGGLFAGSYINVACVYHIPSMLWLVHGHTTLNMTGSTCQ